MRSQHLTEPESSLLCSQEPANRFIRSQITSPASFLKIHFNIILTSMPSSFMWSLSLRRPYQNLLCTSSQPHACNVPRPTDSSRLYRPNNIWRRVHAIKFLIKQSSPVLCYFVPLRPNYLPQRPILIQTKPILLT